MNRLRVVLDTNCLVSALVFQHSRLSTLRTHWQALRFIPLGCRETVKELIRVLAYPKFRLSRQEIESLLGDVVPFFETVEIQDAYAPVAGLRDAQDAVFFHLARQSSADALVSGDEDILAMQGICTTFPIVRPTDFLRSFD
ncbi:MAG: putative toxin-antitoxin system toxin component, PIN family [Desulfovibrio sp.]|jgi:putative PIN family toxin of toxin-antitoxin system|nr:putative toxin-antitoxin system toxin component, PIN family [Desulfovibrio sp.]